ncbi:MAG: Molybdopterin-guanine dinucleotide biosynthesis protein A MobA [Candidatus Methanohalarchaeum thermophilum]|uniref:Molybdopterin-guanine dinucleotide biosynthesis protein A MobA n=1 Tax=Methanohalarchaeum thermophilum TaxID=1903181 RepID=A0A1Q6DW97_METT1|nr:MAG: Molybdopterin-guanine dinucleotide biosynthesis protein A MobA [Candidatus Methanohalarchaeum thermophilum]
MKSAVILAGGESSRFVSDKAFYEVKDKPMIQYVVDKISSITDQVLIVAGNRKEESRLRSKVNGVDIFTRDPVEDYGPVAGIYSGLKRSDGDYTALVACDMPFIKPKIFKLLFNEIGSYDAIIPIHKNGYTENLHSVLKTDIAVQAVEKTYKRNQKRIKAVVDKINTLYYPVEEIKIYDKGLTTFTNINYTTDLKNNLEEFN